MSAKSERKAEILRAHRLRDPSPTAHIPRKQRDRMADVVHKAVSAISMQGPYGRCYMYASACAHVLTKRLGVDGAIQAGALLTAFCDTERCTGRHENWEEMCASYLATGNFHVWVTVNSAEVIDMAYRHTVSCVEETGLSYGPEKPLYRWGHRDDLSKASPHDFYKEDATTRNRLIALIEKHEGAKEASGLALHLWDHPSDELIIDGNDCFVMTRAPAERAR